ncbi:hypothetical protein ALC62_13100 [Cyphomyrmex costatus]|uniref:Uncharacterized protein n=1 Tax=Cyphomyrmex costatus TaxID=456900 RepID=A0A151IAF7_9HYME|nr:hypothetical protein ALC62_13100 [Cyphomyrmex costatus]
MHVTFSTRRLVEERNYGLYGKSVNGRAGRDNERAADGAGLIISRNT